jgi:glutamate formiminotransferase
MLKLVECVPNFSEGEDLTVIEDIVSAVKTAKVLNLHSDPDHNRSVVTLIGEPEAVKQAAFDLTQRAMQLLDVNQHQGAHPFIGVVDVIPFIPLKNCKMSEIQSLAHHFGKELWEKLKLPVFFYGEAAIIAERKELPNVRRGGYFTLKQEINQPHRKPDVGHGLNHTAGAVAVGARDYLIAFNVNLNSQDLDVAKSIAKNIREKDGGLPGVRALGVELESRGITQVTINLIDHKKTSLKQVYDEVKKWAKEYQVNIIESELVGLIPALATFPEMKSYLKLNNFNPNLILDNYL